ncbi:MAG: S8 family peptidase [bacterium]|nr:S8 family peptidase [bacterium]
MRKLALFMLALGLTGSAFATTFTPNLVDKLNSSSPSELIPVMVTMQQQAETDLMQSMTLGLDKRATRESVVGYLKDMAENTQGDIRSYLESLKNSGKVSHVYPLFIVNMISLKATPEIIRQLDNFPGIDNICYEQESFALAGEFTPVGPVVNGYDGTDEITWGLTDIHAPEVWQLGYNGTGVLVGMVDTGVNYNHLDLTDHMWNGGTAYPNHGWNFYSNNSTTMDGYGHGTHTAGTVASDGTAGSQCGVAPNATIMILKVLADNGQGSPAQCMAGLNFAVDHGCDLFSMSLGWYASLITPPDIINFRISSENLLAAGLPGAICAGNEWGSYPVPNNVRTPGRCPPPWLSPAQTLIGGISNVICCGATQQDHSIASFSSHGPSTWGGILPWNDYAYNPGMGLIRPDVSAPGVGTKSCLNTNISGYTIMQGTSMATPHVAGTMALMLQKNMSLTCLQIDSILEVTALDLGTAGKDNVFGAGLINALAAVNATPAGVNPNVTITVTPTGSTTIPASGGTLYFSITVHNNEAFSVNSQAWTEWTIPGGGTQGPFINRNLTIAAGATINRNVQQNVAGSNPAGSYTFWGKMGTGFGGTVYASSSFPFTKTTVASPGEVWYDNNTTYGWDDEQVTMTVPQTCSLSEAYPNPFNPTTTISFSLPVAGKVMLKVYDVSGREVAKLVDGWREAGTHQVTFDATGLTSGVYLYRMTTGNFNAVGKMALLK